ncbi:MAG: S-layer homology domain-containing protein [Clostridia bacterium]|nr:S-layer homology domain-containing protein [Clostridia bacterium]
MKRTKFLSMLLSLSLIFAAAAIPVSAAGFNDVDNDPTVSWAKESIDKMTGAGYIKGYEDGTFRPYRAISKIECLILMARMLGMEDKNFKGFADDAASAYKTTAAKYNSTYPNELSYLLYCGVLEESELVDYASAANANTQLLRYQAAMLMSKLLGADSEAKAYSVSTATYADDAAIPAAAKPYVEYVSANSIMNGMDKTADGRPQFSPLTSLTRAQMATLLARMIGKLDIAYVEGTVDSVSSSKISVDGKSMALTADSRILIDGKNGSASSLSEGCTASVLRANGRAFIVDAQEPQEKTVTYGVVVRKSDGADGRKITIADYENKDNTATYTLSDSCQVYVNDSKATIADIMANNFIKLTLTGSKVSEISTAEKTIDIKGILVSTSFDDEDNVYLNVSDEDGNDEQQYTVSSKGAAVTRDDDEAEFSDLVAGDKVTLRLTYGKITSVTASGDTEPFSGLLKEIIISSNPAITVTINGRDKTYKLSPKVQIYIAEKESTIYDLRPNVNISGKLDNDMVKSISTSTVPVNEKGEFVGTVKGKNTTYKVITVEDSDGNTQSVYYNNNTKFLASNGSTLTVKSISEGTSVSVTGSSKNGVFEATIIIIK